MLAATVNIPTEMAIKRIKEWNLRGYGLNDTTKLLEIENSKHPMPYTQAPELATRRARADVSQRRRFAPLGPREAAIGTCRDHSPLDNSGASDEVR